jgi:metabotropic glutamate receptor 1
MVCVCVCVQVIRKGEVSCCWICTTCKDNEFVQDEFTCKACDLGWWPDEELEGNGQAHRHTDHCFAGAW